MIYDYNFINEFKPFLLAFKEMGHSKGGEYSFDDNLSNLKKKYNTKSLLPYGFRC